MKIVALNLNHKASLRAIKPRLVEGIEKFHPDVLTLNEYVHGDTRAALLDAMAHIGLIHVLFSERLNENNQVLIASRTPLTIGDLLGPDTADKGGESNFLHVMLPHVGMEIVGVRAPAYKTSGELRIYWQGLIEIVRSSKQRRILFVGDLNADPDRGRSVGALALTGLRSDGWTVPSPSGPWSHVSGSRIDHAIAAPSLSVESAEYVTEIGSVSIASKNKESAISDHAALVVQVRTSVNAL
ncbi:endonuclease/exonuclease/phosphatase family protein [Methylibium sp. Root1272]|uniref:endonuclease/exonuclease/phosphatase family protein n=1 Tax=Methylibium sp. Root1272 TaxID=1736441 RepID=UPI0009E820F8|nr:endonuclease/exonuclease/phosphatase family protein [Methylibium sp. Root1272]